MITWEDYNTTTIPTTVTHARFGIKLYEEDNQAIKGFMLRVPWQQRWIYELMMEMNDKHIKTLAGYLKRFTYKPRKNEITPEVIAQVKTVKIEELYQGPLRKAGNRLVGRCPFHEEQSGSFLVYPSQNSWWCYGCQQGGSVVDYVMIRDKISFIEAIKYLNYYAHR